MSYTECCIYLLILSTLLLACKMSDMRITNKRLQQENNRLREEKRYINIYVEKEESK